MPTHPIDPDTTNYLTNRDSRAKVTQCWKQYHPRGNASRKRLVPKLKR
jgi:hypothetical protein